MVSNRSLRLVAMSFTKALQRFWEAFLCSYDALACQTSWEWMGGIVRGTLLYEGRILVYCNQGLVSVVNKHIHVMKFDIQQPSP